MEVTPTVQATSGTGSLTAGYDTGDLGTDAFLNLLVTQLKNQDPLDPMDNAAFLEQLATFSGLEEQQKTTSKLDELLTLNQASLSLGGLSQGASLIGKDVEYLTPTGQQVRGKVYSVFFDQGGVLVEVDGEIVPAGNIVAIASGSPIDPNPDPDPSQPAPTTPTSGSGSTTGTLPEEPSGLTEVDPQETENPDIT